MHTTPGGYFELLRLSCAEWPRRVYREEQRQTVSRLQLPAPEFSEGIADYPSDWHYRDIYGDD